MIAHDCEIIALHSENFERNMRFYLDRICDANHGWHPATLPMMDLARAAKILRAIAGEIESLRFGMVREDMQTEEHDEGV